MIIHKPKPNRFPRGFKNHTDLSAWFLIRVELLYLTFNEKFWSYLFRAKLLGIISAYS
jgi:hypothetical protein